MNGAHHDFYLALAYGVSALLIGAEALMLWRRCRRAAATRRELP